MPNGLLVPVNFGTAMGYTTDDVKDSLRGAAYAGREGICCGVRTGLAFCSHAMWNAISIRSLVAVRDAR